MSDLLNSEMERHMVDFDADTDTSIKINPNFYIHNAILMAQKTLMFSVMKGSIQEGSIGYSVLVEQIEVLCKAARFIKKEEDGEESEYERQIREFKETEEYKQAKQEDKRVSNAKLANKKLELLMREVFRRAPAGGSLSL